MKSSPFPCRIGTASSKFTHLFACISEEDGGYTLQVRLYNKVKPANTAWGEEIADCFETASMLIAALADEFSIATGHVEIEMRLHTLTDGTRH